MGSVLLACIGAGVSLFGAFQYLKGILKGDTRPRLASWTAWGVANVVFTVVAFLQGSKLAAILNGIAALVNLVIICVSVARKQGEKPTGASDWSCLIAALCCLGVLAVFPDNKTLGAFMAMAANITATWPTVVHAWKRPKEEAWQLFAANATAGGLSFAGIALTSGLQLASVAGPLITIIGSSSLTLITAGRGWLTRAEEVIEEDILIVEDLVTTVAHGGSEEKASL